MEQELELPNDVGSLQRMLRILTRDVQQLKVEVVTLTGKNSILQEQINLLLHKRFGANTEKYRAEQSDLFNEAEAYAEESDTQEHQAESCDETELDPTDSITPSNPPITNQNLVEELCHKKCLVWISFTIYPKNNVVALKVMS